MDLVQPYLTKGEEKPANPASKGPLPTGQRSGRGIRGRPRTNLRELAQRHAAQALEKLVALIDSKNERVALSAAQTVLDRAHGKAGQAVDLKTPPGGLTVKILRFNHKENCDAR